MKTENLGEIFMDGKVINLDNISNNDIEGILTKLKAKETAVINKLNRVLAEIQ